MSEAVREAPPSDESAAGLSVFRLVPTAQRDDRRFARDAFHGEVVVRAYSEADARDVAAEAEARAGAVAEGSPFADAALYTVVAVPGASLLRSGKRGVVSGRLKPGRKVASAESA